MIPGNARMKKIERVTLLGSAANFGLLIFKFIAGIIGHSAAMVADAVHSLSDFITDIVVIVFVRIASKPKDINHDYGHGKYETLATVIIGSALMTVGIGLIWNNGYKIYDYYFNDVMLDSPGKIALIAAVVSIAAKESLYRMTVKVGKQVNSQVVVANAWHHRSDAFSSVCTMLGIAGAMTLGEQWRVLDPIAALFVSALILRLAWKLIIPAINELLEKSLPSDTEQEIISIICEIAEIYNPHNLYTRRIGNSIAIELHICVDGDMTVSRSHELTKIIESRLRERFGQSTHIMLHIEPIADCIDTITNL